MTPMRLPFSLSRSLVFPCFFLSLILAWEASIHLFSIPRYILPKPSEIILSAQADVRLRPRR
jgi:ABC-type nitrate/sulfonate/bicarbonate transport system permease component